MYKVIRPSSYKPIYCFFSELELVELKNMATLTTQTQLEAWILAETLLKKFNQSKIH